MGLFFFTLLFSSAVLAVPCTETDLALVAPGNIYNCPDGLEISSAGLLRRGDNIINPLVINVTGDVNIRGHVNLDGQDGVTAPIGSDSATNTVRTSGGNEGGGMVTGDGQPQPTLGNPEDGTSELRNGVCESGGGGGGSFAGDGEAGNPCPTNPTSTGLGGTGFAFSLRGGGGGGGGVADAVAFPHLDIGLGGSGGGAIRIIATGRIIIHSTGILSARGGAGGNATILGGGGGGGGGGLIWLEGNLGIVNNGSLDVRGGNGGVNTNAASPRGGSGGRGANGLFRLNSAGSITNGSGLSQAVKESLKSSIACGTISSLNQEKPNNQSSLLVIMSLGFLMVIMMGSLIRTLSRFPKKF